MARVRSRQVETESVNQRMLRRGAVTRQHLSRWAVGRDELAPGVVGDTHLHPTARETIREIAREVGVGQLLVVSVTGQSFASGGDYVDADTIEYQHGFDGVTAAGESIVWPVDSVGEVQVEFAWDSYEGGGTIEIEVDGSVPDWGLIGSGSSGQVGCKRRGVHIAEGSVVKVKVTQSSGSAKTGDVLVEFSIPDPSVAATPAPGPRDAGQIVVWSMADNVTGLSDGDSMSGWNDRSGFGHHWTVAGTGSPKWEATTGPDGGPAIRVGSESSDGYFVADSGLLDALDATEAAEVFLVVQSAADSGNDGFWKFTGNGSDSHYHYNDLNNIYDSFANDTRVGPIAAGVDLTDWNLYGASQKTGARAMRMNGTVINTAGGGTWSMDGGLLGQSDTFATKDMLIAEILMYDSVLTDAGREIVHTYFADKYGLVIA